MLHTPVTIGTPNKTPDNKDKFDTRCIWDTGASGTVITQNVVDALGLKQTGVKRINTASERNKETATFEIDLYLSDTLVFRTLTVSLGVITDSIDCLLGMDIIGTGDLSITNLGGNTCMSFRHPSSHEIDFGKTPNIGKATPKIDLPAGKEGSRFTQPKKKPKKKIFLAISTSFTLSQLLYSYPAAGDTSTPGYASYTVMIVIIKAVF